VRVELRRRTAGTVVQCTEYFELHAGFHASTNRKALRSCRDTSTFVFLLGRALQSNATGMAGALDGSLLAIDSAADSR